MKKTRNGEEEHDPSDHDEPDEHCAKLYVAPVAAAATGPDTAGPCREQID